MPPNTLLPPKPHCVRNVSLMMFPQHQDATKPPAAPLHPDDSSKCPQHTSTPLTPCFHTSSHSTPSITPNHLLPLCILLLPVALDPKPYNSLNILMIPTRPQHPSTRPLILLSLHTLYHPQPPAASEYVSAPTPCLWNVATIF
ncbi:uncharacterized [Tachysurus ichikawai]